VPLYTLWLPSGEGRLNIDTTRSVTRVSKSYRKKNYHRNVYAYSLQKIGRCPPGFHVIIGGVLPRFCTDFRGDIPSLCTGFAQGAPLNIHGLYIGGYPSSTQCAMMVPPTHYLLINCLFMWSAICIAFDASGKHLLCFSPYICLKFL